MKLTVCQLGNNPEELERDWTGLCGHVKKHGSDLVLLPEMIFAPWLAVSDNPDVRVWNAAEEAHERWMNRLGELGAPCVAGTRPATRTGKRVNEAFVWSPGNGILGIHQKYYLPDEDGFWEATWYERGDGDFSTVRCENAIAGFTICTEMWFFHRARDYGKQGAHLILVPRATPVSSVDKWVAGGRAAAVVAGAYCISSNRAGTAGDVRLGGCGWIADPEGNVLGTTSEQNPFFTADADLSFAELSKTTYPRYVEE